MNVSLTLSFDNQRLARRLQAKGPIAIARAVNRSIASGKTVMVRALSKDMGLKQSAIRDKVKVREATAQRQVAQLATSAKPIPLIHFNARGPEPSRGRGRGVTARNPGGASRFPHAFIATVGSGRHRGVFERVPGANRHGDKPHRSQLPIYELKGPSLAHVAGKHAAVVLARAKEQLVKNLRHELRFALSNVA